MCIRFYPDFIIAIDVHNSMERHIRWQEKNPETKVDKNSVQNLLDDIFISPAGCVERQSEIGNNDLCNAFVGYRNTWTVKDYETYLHKHPELFSKIDDKKLFRLNLDRITIKDDETLDIFSKRFCRNILENAYGTDFLEKYNLC